MRYGKAVMLIAAVMLCCIFIFSQTDRQSYTPDILRQNDITETVKENIGSLDVLSEKFPDTDIMAFDTEGFCIYPDG